MKKIFIFIKRHVRVFLAVLTVLLVIFIISKKPAEDIKKSDYDNLYITKIEDVSSKITVTEFFPQSNKVSTTDKYYPFRITFSEPINEAIIKVEVDPSTEIVIETDKRRGDRIWVRPINGWNYNNSYKVIVKIEDLLSKGETRAIYTHSFYIEEGEVPNIY